MSLDVVSSFSLPSPLGSATGTLEDDGTCTPLRSAVWTFARRDNSASAALSRCSSLGPPPFFAHLWRRRWSRSVGGVIVSVGRLVTRRDVMNVFASDVCASETFGLRVCQKASEPFHGRKRWVIDPRRNDLDVLHTPTFWVLIQSWRSKVLSSQQRRDSEG